MMKLMKKWLLCSQALWLIVVAIAPFLLAVENTPNTDARPQEITITDVQGREIRAIVIAKNEHELTLLRVADQREFTIPLERVSAASLSELANIQPSPVAAAPTEEVDIKPPAVVVPEIPAEVLAGFRTRWQALQGTLESKNRVPERIRRHYVTNHQQLFMLERALVIAGSPTDAPDMASAPESMKDVTRTLVANLRQEIRSAEREWVSQAMLLKENLLASEERADAMYQLEMKLDQQYSSATQSLRRDATRLGRQVARMQKNRNPNEMTLQRTQESLDAAEQAIRQHRDFFFGTPYTTGLKFQPGWPADHPAEILRNEIAAVRVEYLKKLRGEFTHEGEEEQRTGEIGGSYVYSSNLGIILDISGSMTKHIPDLKKQIDEGFVSPLYIEVTGCSLRGGIPRSTASSSSIVSTLETVEEMIAVHEVDTIYWFCDLQDSRATHALRHLRILLRSSGIVFHVKSVGLKPDARLTHLIDYFDS